MSTIRSVDHVQLPIPLGGAGRARLFYEQLLGLREVRDPVLDRPGTLRFSLGWQRLDLTEGHYTGVAPQAHLALRVDQLYAITRRLQQAGVRIDEAPLLDASRVYVEDPFGNRFELIENKASDVAGKHHRVTDLHIAV
jgi:catechol 2,3-dioxygenase-like lactoylglutathione lyase family enzyme